MEDIKPKISVIMPIFNEEEFLSESLEGYFGQTFLDCCELICVDDGSTDASMQILDDWKKRHPLASVKVLRQQNLGSGKARNDGIKVAQGEYIAFLDADDSYPAPDVLEKLYANAIEHGVDIAGGSLVTYDGVMERSDYAHIPGFDGHQFLESGVINYADYQFDYGYQRFIYSRHLLEAHDICFPDYLRYQDPPFFVEAMIAAGSFYAMREPSYWYRSSAKTVKWTDRKLRDMICGMTDVGVLAARHGLERLFRLNLSRLNVDWRPTFKQLVVDEGRLDILCMLAEARGIMRMVNAPFDSASILEDTPSVRLDVADRICSLEGRVESLEAGLEEARRENAALNGRIGELGQELTDAHEALSAVTSSTAWKVGRGVTWVPRRIKGEMLKRKNS